VTTDDVTDTLESAQGWAELRRELEDVGISAPAAEENHDFILERLKIALADGQLSDFAPDMASPRDIGDPKSVPPPPSDSGYGGAAASARGCISSTLSAANNAFEEELRRQRAEWRPGDLEPSMTGSTMTCGPSGGPKVRRRTAPVGMVLRLFKNETAIIEAASEHDAGRVASLIGMGMDVNAKDKWGWSALSMCGYGGYKDIARMLLDHGAELDNVDVDGDTPTSLAAQRGHAELVVMFDAEREARDLKVREMDKEVPRR
jgi:hypothetical protein